MASNNLAFALGLAQKAGKVASGDVAVRISLKSGKAKLLLLACDAAENSKKDMYYLAESYNVPVMEVMSRDELGFAIGKAKRTALAITDRNFVNMIKK